MKSSFLEPTLIHFHVYHEKNKFWMDYGMVQQLFVEFCVLMLDTVDS